MTFYITWTISNKIPLRETIGPFYMLEMARREMEFISTDPYIKPQNIEILEVD